MLTSTEFQAIECFVFIIISVIMSFKLVGDNYSAQHSIRVSGKARAGFACSFNYRYTMYSCKRREE